jgi:hypothetical protein
VHPGNGNIQQSGDIGQGQPFATRFSTLVTDQGCHGLCPAA